MSVDAKGRVRIPADVLTLMEQAAEAAGGRERLAKRLGWSKAQPSRWITGRTRLSTPGVIAHVEATCREAIANPAPDAGHRGRGVPVGHVPITDEALADIAAAVERIGSRQALCTIIGAGKTWVGEVLGGRVKSACPNRLAEVRRLRQPEAIPAAMTTARKDLVRVTPAVLDVFRDAIALMPAASQRALGRMIGVRPDWVSSVMTGVSKTIRADRYRAVLAVSRGEEPEPVSLSGAGVLDGRKLEAAAVDDPTPSTALDLLIYHQGALTTAEMLGVSVESARMWCDNGLPEDMGPRIKKAWLKVREVMKKRRAADEAYAGDEAEWDDEDIHVLDDYRTQPGWHLAESRVGPSAMEMW